MITIYDDLKQGTPEWHAKRDDKYTGGNADKLLRFGAIEYARSTASSFGGNFWTKRGHLLEDEAIDLYASITGHRIRRPGFVENSKYPSAGYSPDGIAYMPLGNGAELEILLEVKCFDIPHHMQLVNGNIPMKILAQAHFGMLICGIRQAQLIAYNPTAENVADKFRVIDIKLNRKVQANIKERLANDVRATPART